MKAAERLLRLRAIFEGQEFADLTTLRRALRTSESTVRRDLQALEKEGVVRRVHGGALTVPKSETGYDFAGQARRMAGAKARIARAAAALVEDGQMVILDGGSTVARVAEALADRPLHAITNSLAIAQLLRNSRRVEVTLTGGYLFPRLEVMLGPLCERMIGSVSADVLVMGIGGITPAGFSNNNTLLVGSEQKMIEVSRKVIIVADATKFGRAAMVPLAPLEVADVVVSDPSLAPGHRAMLEQAGVEIVIA